MGTYKAEVVIYGQLDPILEADTLHDLAKKIQERVTTGVRECQVTGLMLLVAAILFALYIGDAVNHGVWAILISVAAARALKGLTGHFCLTIIRVKAWRKEHRKVAELAAYCEPPAV